MGYTYINKKLIIKEFIKIVLTPMAIEVRNEISNSFNIAEGCFKNYKNTSYYASEIFINKLDKYFNNNEDLKELFKYSSKIQNVIQKRHPRLNSNNWNISHSYVILSIFNKNIYVDLTSQEFTDIYDDIPDFFISTIKPKWYIKKSYKIYDKLAKPIFDHMNKIYKSGK